MKLKADKQPFYGKRITMLRFMNGYTVQDLADKCECSKQYVSHWECETRIPTRAYVLMLCEIFGVTTTFFTDEFISFQMYKNQLSFKVYSSHYAKEHI